MKVEQTICDECKRQRGESNHWHKIGVRRDEEGRFQLTIGIVPEKEMPGYVVHDLCGEQCFHKHIDALIFKRYIPVMVDLPPMPSTGGISIDVASPEISKVEYTGA